MSVLCELYDGGSYGLVLEIVTHSREELVGIQELLRRLTTKEIRTYVLEDGDAFTMSGLAKVTMGVPERLRRGKQLTRTTTKVGVELTWNMDSDGWRHGLELVSRLVEDNESGHQYLSIEGVDDVLVKVSYLERMVQPNSR